ncbi:PREDICTED: U4/U6 small nuclear ribonucleoprotein Prp31-like, partial [Bison bison bison]|uniref:U4/U6 small nuclear ribonucleoprotein Prp31 n=1 Tax=Bison bison bison TaxID=43346 RepID=A0A6P3H607_BISBB
GRGVSPHSRALTGQAVNGQGRRQLVTVLLGSSWTGAWLVGKARPAGSRELKGAFQKEGTPAKSPAAAWPGPACLPRAEKRKRQGCATTGCFASRPRGWWGGWGPSPLRTGPPEVRVIRSAPAAPPPCRQQLSEEELERLEEACDMALELNASKHRIYEYVESRMSFIAPNLSIIIGASTAAKIMGVAGGLTNLSKMPACNIMLLGAQRKTLSGFSSTSVLPHTGYIYHSDIVQSLPPDLRRKAARLVAAKCTLAARVDSFHESTEGKVRAALASSWLVCGLSVACLSSIEERSHQKTPLHGDSRGWGAGVSSGPTQSGVPSPTLPPRYRKMKERLGLTEIRKQANRMSFGEIEEDAYQEDLGFSLGHLGKSGSGRVRQTQVNEATKARISKTLQRTLQKQSVVYGGKSTIRDRSSGTASSVAFTPLQGLEIVNPQAAEKKVAEANQKYFSSMAEFLKVKGEKSGITST